jgi:beta-glucosidase
MVELMQDASSDRLGGGFPLGFLWGCATSATQIEGHTVNEWAGVVAEDGSTADDGPMHWDRFEQDFDLLSKMGLNAYRLGVDWGRLQPAGGQALDSPAVAHYSAMLDSLRSRGIEPFVTLFHFACPKWLSERGGWENQDAPRLFADFAERTAAAFNLTRFWITLNEPVIYVIMAYLEKAFPPSKRRFRSAVGVLKRLQMGHRLAFERIKAALPQAQVGVAHHARRYYPHRRWHPIDRAWAWILKRIERATSFDPFIKHRGRAVADFVGVNYYGRARIKGFRVLVPMKNFPPQMQRECGALCDDMFEHDPEYLEQYLFSLSLRTHLPLYVTENGIGTNNDQLRRDLLLRHLASCRAAIARGVDLRGYFHWSLIDNFEWNKGYTKKFGLVAVDFRDPTKPRQIKASGMLFGRFVAEATAASHDGRRADKLLPGG